jgi:hypothetical protein
MATFDDRFNELLGKVGRPYEMLNKDGTYQGCFYPVQILYPDKPRYKMRSLDDDKNYLYGLSKIRKHCTEITPEELKKGDIIATRFKDELHVAVYWEYGKIIHVFKLHELYIGKLDMFKEYKCFRVKE